MATSTASKTPGEVEVDRMRRAADFSKVLWAASRGVLTLVGAVAPVTLGYQLAKAANREALNPVIYAILAIIVGAICFQLVQWMTASRTRDADNAANSRAAAYVLIFVFTLIQVFATLVAAPVLQGVAVYQALAQTNPVRDRDLALAARIDLYSQDPSSIEVVRDYCKKNSPENDVSANLLRACSRFTQPTAPDANTAQQLAAALHAG
jgi:hypothetical protein